MADTGEIDQPVESVPEPVKSKPTHLVMKKAKEQARMMEDIGEETEPIDNKPAHKEKEQ